MSKLAVTILVTSVIGAPALVLAQPWYDTYDFASAGVVGYWPLDGDARDVSANGHDGAPSGDVGFSIGRFGMAATFDGMGDYILLAGQVGYQDEFTACGWLLRSGLSENFYSYIFIKTTNVNNGYQSLGYYHDLTTSMIHVDVSDFADPWYLRHFVSLPEGQWHHLCTTVKPGDVRLFLDGASVAQAALTGVLDHESFTGNYIGGFPQILFGPYSHNGLVDEVVIFNHALSPNEVRALCTDTNGDGIADFWVSPVVVFRCAGFEAPLDRGPVTVRGRNRVLPLRAKLFDTAGVEVTAGRVTSAPVLQVLYDSGTGDAVDITDQALPAGAANGGNQFTYTTDGWWQYNLSLKGFSAGGSYLLSVTSGDEAVYVIRPTCQAVVVLN